MYVAHANRLLSKSEVFLKGERDGKGRDYVLTALINQHFTWLSSIVQIGRGTDSQSVTSEVVREMGYHVR